MRRAPPVTKIDLPFSGIVVDCNSGASLVVSALGILLHSHAMSGAHQVIVYSRKGCHLCQIVKETLLKLERRGGFTWREVDVDSDDALRRQFTDEVPVVFIDGKKAFKYRMAEKDFLRRLES